MLVPVVILMGASAEVSALDYTADLSLSVSEQYNDNIFLTRSNKVQDFITIVTPAVALSTRTEKAEAMINYSPSFLFYHENDDNNSITHQASARGLYRLSDSLTLGLSDAYVYSKESSVLRTIEGSGPITRGQETISTNTLIGDISYRLSGQFSLQGAATYTATDVSHSETGDYSTYAGRLGINYLFDEKTTLRANATYTFYDYSIAGNANSQEYTLGANYRITPTITADGYGGVVTTRIAAIGKTFTGFAGGLSVAKTFERGIASLAFVQGVSAGIESPTPLRSQVITLRYAMPATELMNVSLSAFYGRYRSIGDTVNIVATNRSEFGGTIEIAYRIWRRLSAILSYSYVNSDDKASQTGSYVNNIVMIGLRLSQQAKF